MRVLILGSTGMLGHVVTSFLSQHDSYEVVDVSYRKRFTERTEIIDIRHSAALAAFMNNVRPDFIINCVGVLINGSNLSAANAIYINSFFPHWLAEESNKINSKVIHISTDCVFNGLKGGYGENDFPDAIDIYGRSKALGELNNDLHLTLRTSIIGPELKLGGDGLFDWFVKKNGVVSGYNNVKWGGVTTFQLAVEIEKHLRSGVTGILNVTNGSSISKFELLEIVRSTFNLKRIELLANDAKASDKSLISVRSNVVQSIPSYRQMVIDLKGFMQANAHLYPHYQNILGD